MPETHDSPRLLTARQAADIAKVDVSTLRTWIRQGDLRAAQREPQILVDQEDLEQFLQQRTPPTQAAPPEHEPLMDDEGGTPRQLTARKAATIAKVHPKTILKWVRRGNLRAVQREPQTLIDQEDLEQFLRDRNPPVQATSTEIEAATDTAPRDDKLGELAEGMTKVLDAPQLLTAREVADIAKVDVSTARKWVREKSLPAVQREPQILVDANVLEQFLRQRMSPAQVVSTTSKDEGQDADIHQSMPAVAFSRKDAAVLLGVHPDTINRWRRQGHLKATPQGLIPLAEIKRLTAATTPSSGTQLELLGDPVLPSPALAGEVSPALTPPLVSPDPATTGEAAPALTPSWAVLVRLLEASYQREAKLAEQLDVVNTILLRLVGPSGPRSSMLSGHGDPLTPPLTEQVLAFLREHPGPHRSVEVRDALGLPHSPKNTLQSLFQRKLIERLAPGVFQAVPDDKPISPLEPGEGTLLARVLAYVRETTGDDSRRRGVRSWQVQKALDLSQSTNRTLTRLVERQLIYRIGKGLYSARPLAVDEEKDTTKQVTEEGLR